MLVHANWKPAERIKFLVITAVSREIVDRLCSLPLENVCETKLTSVLLS